MEYDQDQDRWRSQNGPIIIGDDLSMDDDASVIAFRVHNDQGDSDTLITFVYDNDGWTEYANRLEISSLQSFELSPTGGFLVTTIVASNNEVTISTYWLSEDQESPEWLAVDHEVIVSETPSLSLARDLFAITTPDAVIVYSYSGRRWGEPLVPNDNLKFTSTSLSYNGRNMTVASLSPETQLGVVDWFYFPLAYDSGDDWEEIESPLRDEWELEQPTMRDVDGKESFLFGSNVELDEGANRIAVQSGLSRNENVHIYDVVLPPEE